MKECFYSPNTELIVVGMHPYHLASEFMSSIVITVCILPLADAGVNSYQLHCH